MPSPNDPNPPVSSARRRITLRRGNYGSMGHSTQARGMREGGEDTPESDEVDDAVEGPLDTVRSAQHLNNRVRDTARPVTIDSDYPTADADGLGGPADRANPRARLSEVAAAGSAAYSKEYRLSLLHRLLMRRVPIDQIARQLNVSISTVEKDRVALKARLREHAKELDINEVVGRNLEIYDEIRGMSLRVASSGEGQNGQATVPTAMKLAAMRTALAATNDSTRMLSAAGVFDALRFRAAETAAGQTDMQRLMAGADDLLRSLLEDDGADMSEPPAAPVARTVKRGGFKPLGMDDNDSDSAAQEMVEL